MAYHSSVAHQAESNWLSEPQRHSRRQKDLGPGHLIAKRITDVTIASVSILFFLPFFLFVAACIKLDSKGPVLFRQRRWGKNGRIINVYKFRSMRTDLCDVSGVKQTTKDDPRVTRVGSILRRTNVDELPQLWNVLIGDMSLVGPRCHAIGMLAAGVAYEELVPNYHDRHVVRPGLTGLAQVRGFRGPTDRRSKAKARIACDLYYIENFSIWLDFRIMIATVWTEFRGGSGF